MSHAAADPLPSSRPLHVLVLGAGWLGRPLAEAFAADGATVTTVRRTPHDPVHGGRALAVDLTALASPLERTAPDALRQQFGVQDVVIAAVAPNRASGDSHGSTYPAAARAAVAIAEAVDAAALAWVSSTGVYGYTDGREVTENTPRDGSGPAFEALAAAEDTVLAATSPKQVVLRVAGLYGPGRDPASRYRDPVALAGRSGQWLNLAWRDDVIDAVRYWTAAALRGDDVPTILNVADGTPLTVAEAARLVAQADGRAFVAPSDTAEGAPVAARSNQRIRVQALHALGWRPAVPHLRLGLQRLGYDRLRTETQRYGPQTTEVRAMLRDLAALGPEAHARVCQHWQASQGSPALTRADRLLGEIMVRVHREAERDAAAGPLLQMLRSADEELDPVAEPALSALMALVVRDALPVRSYQALTESLAEAIPWLHEAPTG